MLMRERRHAWLIAAWLLLGCGHSNGDVAAAAPTGPQPSAAGAHALAASVGPAATGGANLPVQAAGAGMPATIPSANVTSGSACALGYSELPNGRGGVNVEQVCYPPELGFDKARSLATPTSIPRWRTNTP
jgi:hypothetical protein